ncbi:MAG: hypothetical protein LBT03_00930 [Holosporales bacterium]|nr:hypothetical protein [Holosporales bacterium]
MCSLLFFVTGTLVGYAVNSQSSKTESEKIHPARKQKEQNPILGRVVNDQKQGLPSKVRIPSSPAIDMAKTYLPSK